MPLRNARPLTIRPVGVSDAVDGTNAFPGAMTALVNLVPSPSTQGVFVPRSASVQQTDFSTFTDPAQGTALLVLGDRAYGMIASGAFTGKDEPFCYDLVSGAFVAISGTTSANLPGTQSATGGWVPPCIQAITKTKIIVCHPGFDGVTHFFGTIDITNPAAPAWSSGNTTPTALAAVPKAVAQYNGRAWYAVQNNLVYSDSLAPGTVTNASQVLTLGDSLDVTAVAGLPLNTQLTGGQIQSLIAFKGAEQMWQITGDAATSNLQQNNLNVATGTLAPNTITPTTQGLAFVAPDGVRIIDFQAQVGDPIGANGAGVNVPFLSAINPSRMAAAFNENTLRITVQNGAAAASPVQEWWFNFSLQAWTGPHTFGAALIQPYFVGDNGFVSFASGVDAILWQSNTVPKQSSTYTENGVALAWAYQTALLPDNQQMAENAVIEAALALQMPSGQQIVVQSLSEVGDILDTVYMTAVVGTSSIWGSFTWGTDAWGSAAGYFKQYQIGWHVPLVFKQMSMLVTGASQASFAIGNLYLRYQILGYLLQA